MPVGMMDEQPERKLISVEKARQKVGVSRNTIYNWARKGKIQYVRTAGNQIRIYEDTLTRAPGPDDLSPYRN